MTPRQFRKPFERTVTLPSGGTLEVEIHFETKRGCDGDPYAVVVEVLAVDDDGNKTDITKTPNGEYIKFACERDRDFHECAVDRDGWEFTPASRSGDPSFGGRWAR